MSTKYKPVMAKEEEFDRDLHESLKMLLLELRTISPFFGVLATELWIAGPAKNIKTLAVSESGVIVYNQEFMRGLTPGEKVAAIVHEALHVALDFWTRFKGQNFKVANYAHDFANNSIIVKSMSSLKILRKNGAESYDLGVKLGKGWLYDEKYDNWSAEEIYNDLFEGINKRTKEIRQQIDEIMSDPAKKAEHEREQAINRELRKSFQAAGKMVDEKQSQANSKAKAAKEELKQQNDEFYEALRDSAGSKYEENAIDEVPPKEEVPPNSEDQKPEEGEEGQSSDKANQDPSPDQPQSEEDQSQDQDQNASDDASSSPEKNGEPSNSGDSSNASPAQDASSDQGMESPGDSSSEGQPGEASPGDQSQPGSGASNPYQQAKEQLANDMNKALTEFMSKEKDRIGNEYDGSPDGSTREENLEEFGDKLDGIAEDYVDKVTKAREDGIEEPAEDPSKGDKKGDEPSSDAGSEPGDESGKEAGSDAGSEPGNDPGGDGPGDGEAKPGDGPGQQGQGQGQGQPGDAPGQSQGQPGGGQGAGGEPVSDKQAKTDVAKAMEDLVNDMTNAFNGNKPMDGIDNQMASGQDMMEQGAYDQAMKELHEKLGNPMEGDIDLDCSDIAGNPYKNESMEEMDERRRQMLQRAVIEDMQHGGQGMGSLPGWMKSEIDGILHPPMGFLQELEKFVGPWGALSKRSFSVRNKRNSFQQHHMIRPGMRTNDALIYIVLDVSGSMMNGADADNLRHAMGLVEQLAFGMRLDVKVIQNDTGVTRVLTTQEALEELAGKKFEVHGQGGSDLTPAFEMIWKEIGQEGGNRGSPIVVFTDGAITVPEEVPPGLRQQTLFVTLPHQRPPTTKWGEHIVMQNL